MGRPSTLDPRLERTRAAVLRATADVLAGEGLGALTIEAIAERSGVARSTVYRNWPDRSDLLVEAFEVLCAFAEIPDLGSIEAELRALGDEIVDGLVNQAWGQALPSLIGASAHDRDVARALESFSRRRFEIVSPIFDRAIERGELPTGVDSWSLAEAFAAGFFFRKLVGAGPLDNEFLERQIGRVLAGAADG